MPTSKSDLASKASMVSGFSCWAAASSSALRHRSFPHRGAHAMRARCHRIVYGDGDGRREDCPGSLAVTGRRADGRGRWNVVDASSRHAGELQADPRPVPVPMNGRLAAPRSRPERL